MIKLINGRGQLGNKLKDLESVSIQEDILIYHTWNLVNKLKHSQKQEYEKFVSFVNDNHDKKIVFISTLSTKDNWYNFYKQKSEAYLISNNSKGMIIRLPTLIGKGMFEKLKYDEIKPTGYFTLSTIEKCVTFIENSIFSNSIVKVHAAPSENVSAEVVHCLIKYGLGD